MKKLPRISTLGWLPVSQAGVMVVSLTAFAFLSRLIGPEAYAQFAVLAFVYSICALVTDFSAMGYLLVHGDSAATRRASWVSAVSSSFSGVIVLAAVLAAMSFAPLPLGPPGFANSAILVAGLVAQALAQPIRGQLMLRRDYPQIATTDFLATLVAYGTTILVATRTESVTVLCMQLTLTSVLRLLLLRLMLRRHRTADDRLDRARSGRSAEAFAYGLRVMPLNVAAYASRSIDSGVLPLILPAAAAATYARSYQLIVSPITQVQLSLGGAIVERIARHETSSPDERNRFDKRLWLTLHAVTLFAAVALSLCSPLIKAVFFGPGWLHVDLFIASMGVLLPALTLSTYMSWKLQVRANLRHSLMNLTILMLVPSFAIVAALLAGTTGAVVGLAVGALTQGCCLALVHRRSLPVTLRYALAQIVLEWLVLGSLVALRL